MIKLKITVILLGFMQPLIILYFFGADFKSFSKTWNTELEPLFILTNATTSYFLYGLKRWRISAVLLMLLTAFSTVVYSDLHNFFAILFFISVFIAFFEYKSLRYYPWVFLFVIGIGAIFSLFWLEFFGTWVICIYHLHVMNINLKFKNRGK